MYNIYLIKDINIKRGVKMTKSMTGFGRGEFSNENYHLKIELKAVNHRYSDINIKMPRHMNYIEEKIKKMVKDKISRGKIDVYVKLEYVNEASVDIKADMDLANSYKKTLDGINQELNLPGDIKISNLLTFPDIIKTERKEIDEESLWEVLERALNSALADIMEMKVREGKELENDMVFHLKEIERGLKEIEKRSPVVVTEYKEKLNARIEELLGKDIEVDQEKLGQEVAYFADKSDITEEVTRLKSHISQFQKILEEEIIGRKLDFLIQEMNREVNTIGSKANDVEISAYVVDIKAEIEKIREQAQNVE